MQRRHLLAQEEPGRPDGELDEQDSSVWKRLADQLLGRERLAIKGHRGVSAADEDVRRQPKWAHKAHADRSTRSKPAASAARTIRRSATASSRATRRPAGVRR